MCVCIIIQPLCSPCGITCDEKIITLIVIIHKWPILHKKSLRILLFGVNTQSRQKRISSIVLFVMACMTLAWKNLMSQALQSNNLPCPMHWGIDQTVPPFCQKGQCYSYRQYETTHFLQTTKRIVCDDHDLNDTATNSTS